MPYSLPGFLIVSGLLFSFGVYTVLTRRNVIGILMGIELILNAAALNFVIFTRFTSNWPADQRLAGHVFTLFVIGIAAAEVAVALAIVLGLFAQTRTIDVQHFQRLGDRAGEANPDSGRAEP
ncbi:MAG: NADH-quinone oxidoreductase subunit NuoK [Thermodesulfobacteriota bacterium]